MTTITARKAAIRISIRRQNASMTRVTPPPSSGQMLASNDDSLHHRVAEDIVRMASRERLPEPSNPLGMDGIEFVEYATSQPQGVGDSLIYFVDRYRDFTIYDVDFIPLPGADPRPPALAGLHYFGVVQAILGERTRDWVDFYRHLFGFSVLPRGQYFGVLPKGTLLESPCHKFYLQLIEPPPGADDIQWDEGLVRLGLGAANVPGAVRALQERGIVFVDHGSVQPSDKGALTQFYLGGVTFELVVSHL